MIVTLLLYCGLVWLGFFSGNEGLNNVGLTALWIMVVLLGIIAFVPSGDGVLLKQQFKAHIYFRYFGRTVLALLLMTVFYTGHFVMGAFFAVFATVFVMRRMDGDYDKTS